MKDIDFIKIAKEEFEKEDEKNLLFYVVMVMNWILDNDELFLLF